MPNILVLSANPKTTSLTQHLAAEYVNTIDGQSDVQFFELHDMQFDPNLHAAHNDEQPLEDDLIRFQQALTWCDHFVIVTPIWWGSMPAKLKGLIDRTFLPGFAFKYVKGKAFPKQLLKGRSARVICLMDTPPWYYRLVQRSPIVKELGKPTLEFVGFKISGYSFFGPVLHSSQEQQPTWRNKVAALATQDAKLTINPMKHSCP